MGACQSVDTVQSVVLLSKDNKHTFETFLNVWIETDREWNGMLNLNVDDMVTNQQRRSKTYLIMEGNVICGFFVLVMSLPPDLKVNVNGNNPCMLNRLYISPPYRKCGICKTLMKGLISYLDGYDTLVIKPSSLSAYKCYSIMGWGFTSYIDGEPLKIMIDIDDPNIFKDARVVMVFSRPSQSVNGGKAVQTRYILGRERKITREGRYSMITYKGQRMCLTEARAFERRLRAR